MGVSACSACTSAAAPASRLPAFHVAAHSSPSEEPPDGQHSRFSIRESRDGFAMFDLIPDNRGSLESLYTVEREIPLGEGSYSSVYKCTNKETEQERAVKIIERKLLRSSTQIEQEVRTMSVLDHPNIVRLIESFEDARGAQLVLELCSGGELLDLVMDKAPISERLSAICMQQILRTVAYLHRNQIIHRDLKAENWLLADDRPLDSVHLKLIDFGLARRLGPNDAARTKCGTPYYVAPEVIAGRYTAKADIWSCGVVMHMLLTGLVPFSGNDTKEVFKNIESVMIRRRLNENLRGMASQEAISFLESLLERDMNKRPAAVLALQGPWLDKSQPVWNENSTGFDLNDPEVLPVLQRLRSFGHTSHIERAALTAVVSQLDREDLRDLEKVFMRLDSDCDGMLSYKELTSGIRAAGMQLNEEEAASLMERLDSDGSGAVDYSEFLVAAMDVAGALDEGACWRAFKMLDTNGNDMLERAELARVLGGAVLEVAGGGSSQADIKAFLEQHDSDNDGLINFEEFKRVVRSLFQREQQ